MAGNTKSNKTGTQQSSRCEYELEYEGQKQKMVINCKGCTQNYSMANPGCISGILHALSEVFMVDYLYISQYLDTMYFGDSVELLEQMKSLVNQIGNYSLRRPDHQFKQHHPKYKKKVPCAACPVNPQKLFTKLKSEFASDFEIFYNHLNPMITEVHKLQPRADYCNNCRYNTLENLEDVFNRFEKITAFILLSAYKIIYHT